MLKIHKHYLDLNGKVLEVKQVEVKMGPPDQGMVSLAWTQSYDAAGSMFNDLIPLKPMKRKPS